MRPSESRSSYGPIDKLSLASRADTVAQEELPQHKGRSTSVFDLLENPHKHTPEVIFTTGSKDVEAKTKKKRSLVNTFFSSIFGGSQKDEPRSRYAEQATPVGSHFMVFKQEDGGE